MAENELDVKVENETKIVESEPESESDSETDEATLSNNVRNFEEKIRNRANPYTYLKYDYKFSRVNSHEKSILRDITRALLGCAPFIDKIRQKVSEPVASEFRKIIEILAYGKRRNLDITNLYSKYSTAIRSINSKAHFVRDHGAVIKFLATIWRTSRFRKLFSIVRTIMGYCVICKKDGPPKLVDIVPYIVHKRQLNDPDYDMEDSLYAERIIERYTCSTCGMVTDYKVMITTAVPDIITVVPPIDKRWENPPRTLTLPCEETRTHYYTLASFIYTHKKNDKSSVGIITEDGVKYINSNDNIENGADTNTLGNFHHYNLLCYVKTAVVENYKRVLD